MILYINIQSGLPQLNIKKKIGIWIPQKTTRNDSGLNDIEGLPYIIIQSGLPRLNINKKIGIVYRGEQVLRLLL